jgi:ABC-type spermidine/putrescine transport system permease subunit II
MSLGGMSLGVGGIIESHLATKMSFMGIIISVAMSRMGEKLEQKSEGSGQSGSDPK